jgi:dGTPase
VEDIRHAPVRLARFSESARGQNAQLKGFLFSHIYNHPLITEDCNRSIRCLEELFAFYLEQPGAMPELHEEMSRTTARHIVVCDYIAGMTDQFLLRQHHEHVGSSASAPPAIGGPQKLE